MKYLFIAIVSVFAALTVSAQERDDACVFDKFEYEATVHTDNSWTIHETIVADFSKKRHGIFQYIELPFTAKHGGNVYNCTTDVTDVSVTGDKFKVSSEESGRYCVIRIGDADRSIIGSHTYNIDYTLHFFDDGYTGADMLYASVLGAQWKNDIREFSFAIQFENNLPAGFADSLKVYSGALGSTANGLGVTYEVDTLNNRIVGQASGISHHNAITLKATLPEGYWEMTGVGPAPTAQVDSFYGGEESTQTSLDIKNTVLITFTFLAFLVALVYLLTHRRRNPIVSVEYSAPDGLSSAEVGYVVDNTADVSDLSSLIVWWASRGYLTIEEEQYETSLMSRMLGRSDNEIVLTVKKPLPSDAPEFQQKFWQVFFGGTSKTCRLSDLGDKHEEIRSAMRSLEDWFTAERKLMQIDNTAVKLTALFFVMAVVTFLLSADSIKESLHVSGMWLGGALMYGLFWKNIMEKGFRTYISNTKMKQLLISFGIVLFCLGISIISALSLTTTVSLPGVVVLGIALCGLVLMSFTYHMQKNTPYRMAMLSRILGFKEFIRAAEMPMLKAMVDENPAYFYDVLPYALAFGLSDKWCKQFESISIEAPDWYICDGVTDLNVANGFMIAQSLTDSFDNVIAASIQSSSIDPSSSDSGGGYSGGGGGGGGGGSW